MTTPFLKQIADHFATQYPRDLYRYRFFVPNRRSALFLQQYIQQSMGDRIYFAPQTTTLNEYINAKSDLVEPEEIVLLSELYYCYCDLQQGGEEEREYTFDSFYQIGSLILHDFQDIDKHLADAAMIYHNLQDLKEIEADISYLSDDQRSIISSFLKPIPMAGEHRGEMTQKFLYFWERLLPLYRSFTTSLRAKGLGYSGMITRQVAEMIKAGKVSVDDGYINVFLGLNALTPAEHLVLKYFKATTTTLFYWDYDSHLVRGNAPASFFMQSNLERYPEPKDQDAIPRQVSYHTPAIEVAAIPSAVAQTAYLSRHIDALAKEYPEAVESSKAAVVLPNEHLLLPMLSSIPDSVKHLNITMGYPVSETPIVALLSQLTTTLRHLQQGKHQGRWRGQEVMKLVTMSSLAPFFASLSAKVCQSIVRQRLIYMKGEEIVALIQEQLPNDTLPTEQERIMRLARHIFLSMPQSNEEGVRLFDYFATLLDLLIDERVQLPEEGSQWMATPTEKEGSEAPRILAEPAILARLLYLTKELQQRMQWRQQQMARSLPLTLAMTSDLLMTTYRNVRIPYEGEPLKGLQVMGVLETRSLDFDTIFLPDCAEGMLPQRHRQPGIIPHSLRLGYGLPTFEWQERTRAYNFFRLISRAHRVVVTYDARKGMSSLGEPSRYLRTLDYIFDAQPLYGSASYPIEPLEKIPIQSDLDSERVAAHIRSLITPDSGVQISASALKDYLACPRRYYYTQIRGLKSPEEFNEYLQSNDLGTLVHTTLDHLYREYKGQVIPKNKLDLWLNEASDHVRQVMLRAYRELQYGTHSDGTEEPKGYNLIQFNYALQLVQSLLQKDRDYPSPIIYVGGEMRIEGQLPLSDGRQVNIKGFIDRVDLDGHTLRVIDYKTGRDTYELNFDAEEINGAAMQLAFYCHLIKRLPETHPLHALLPAHSAICPMIIKPHDAEASGRLKDGVGEIEEYSEEIETEAGDFFDRLLSEMLDEQNLFYTRPSSTKCNYCPANQVCLAQAYNEGDSNDA